MELGGEGGVLVERVLEPGREVDLGRLDAGEAVEQLVGKGARSVLDGANVTSMYPLTPSIENVPE